MTTYDVPSLERVLELPSQFDQRVGEDFIDENGHMNITHYFRLGTWAPWLLLSERGMGQSYIEERGLSCFTVEHRIQYVGELRLGERFSVHAGLVARTGKALHAVGIVADREHDRVSCVLEVVYVHISMESRRALPFPDDVAAALDTEIAEHPWLPEVATGLSLRR